MTCDYCNKPLTPGDEPRHAPGGLPLFVCKRCYSLLSKQSEEKKPDCTDCIRYGICYLRRHRANKDDVTPCEDIETIDKED